MNNHKYQILRLCFGHAGGGYHKIKTENNEEKEVYGWYADSNDQWVDDDNYARRVIKLCKEYQNVYCDMSYLHDIIDNKKFRDRFIHHLIQAIETPGTYPFSKKIIFGSDWHMPNMINRSKTYFDKFIEIFQEYSQLNKYIEDFISLLSHK